MKKIFLLVAVTIMGVVSVNAQSGYEDTTHEIGVSIGEMSNSKWVSVADFMGTTIFSIGTVKYENGSFTGPISVEYFYHYNPVVNLGAIAVFAQESKDIVINGDKSGDAKNTYLTVLPAAKFNWLRTKNFGMYSKLAAGLTYMSRKEDYKKDYENQSDSKFFFSWQISALGMEAGSENVRGFLEFGVGEQGMALIGLRYKF